MRKRALIVSAVCIAGILLFNLGKFADIQVERSRMSSGQMVGISGLMLGDSESSSGSETSGDNNSKMKSDTAGNGSGSGNGENALIKEAVINEDETQAEANKEAVTEPKTEAEDEVETNSVSVQEDALNSDDIPYYSKTDVIGYITCSSANLNNAEITYGDDQWIVDKYNVCMAQDYALPDYFGAGHPVLLAGHNNKSLSGLHNVSIGDIITINSTYGKTFTYKVIYSSVVYNSNNQTLLDMTTKEPVVEFYGTSDVLQIYTCADDLGYNLNYRYFVKAELVQNANAA